MKGNRASLRVLTIVIVAVCLLLALNGCSISGRQKWEYKVASMDKAFIPYPGDMNLLESELNALGEQGWECENQVFNAYAFVCKRPK